MKRLAALCLTLLLLSFCWRVSAASFDSHAEAVPALRRFYFSIGGELPLRSWEIQWEDGGFQICENGGEPRSFPSELAVTLLEILEDFDVASWDGFHDYDPDVLDGMSFSLEVEYADGTLVFASGENAFPEGYHEASSAFMTLLHNEKMAFLSGLYRYDGHGESDAVVTLYEDGTWTFSAEYGDGLIRKGKWSVYDNAVYVTSENSESLPFLFGIEDDALLYFTMRSEPEFLPSEIRDGARFVRQ